MWNYQKTFKYNFQTYTERWQKNRNHADRSAHHSLRDAQMSIHIIRILYYLMDISEANHILFISFIAYEFITIAFYISFITTYLLSVSFYLLLLLIYCKYWQWWRSWCQYIYTLTCSNEVSSSGKHSHQIKCAKSILSPKYTEGLKLSFKLIKSIHPKNKQLNGIR